MSCNKPSLIGMKAAEISSAAGLKQKYRGKQIFEWLCKGAASFDQMANLPADLRTSLDRDFLIFSSEVTEKAEDEDETAKVAIKLCDGSLIEAVLLRDENGRSTACLSSQAGCAMGCTFCRTGKMGLRRNLSSAEMIEQYMHLKNLYGDIGNIVYMGMGEPFRNTDEVIKSLRFFTDEDGLGMSTRRITLSTCGIISGINRLGREGPPVRLAVSLVTAENSLRSDIMPVNLTNGLDALKDALISYQKNGGRRITLECALIGGINDSGKAAAQIAEWAEGLSVNVNVIPWNPASEIDYREPSPSGLEDFCRTLERKKIPYTRRYRRGRGLNAACGQLATKLENNE